MASPLIQRIEKDFLSCCICFEELKDPIGLPCLHGFCFECLERWSKSSKDKTEVICPTCKKAAPMPKEGIRGFPGHFLVKNLKETVDKNRVEENDDVICSTCGKTALKHCMDCKKNLCLQCHAYHDAFTKDHVVVTTEEQQSGQVTDEGRFCEEHGEKVKYYCETEEKQVCTDCISLTTCPIEHKRVTLKDASTNITSSIDNLVKKCTDTSANFKDVINDVNKHIDNLKELNLQIATDLANHKKDYLVGLAQAFKKYEDDILNFTQTQIGELEGKVSQLELQKSKIEETCVQAIKLKKSKSEYVITKKYPPLSESMKLLMQSQPPQFTADSHYPKFKAAPVVIPFIGNLTDITKWKFCTQFITKYSSNLHSVNINQNGDIVLSSWDSGVKLYTGEGVCKSTIYVSKAPPMAITPDNRYAIAPLNNKNIEFLDHQGNRLSSFVITNTDNRSSNANTLAADAKGRIILGQVENTISIHHADGSHISKFQTKSTPFRLAITSHGELACSFLIISGRKQGKEIKLMDYHGYNARCILPPEEVKTWSPSHVCSGQEEIFVVNNVYGDPTGIYQYTADGEYLGCVTTDVSDPRGIVLSPDGNKLFVAEESSIKIFCRQ